MCALIFFDTKFHEKIIVNIKQVLSLIGFKNRILKTESTYIFKKNFTLQIVACFFLIQLLFPWRYLLYPDELFWTEEGYRFSWRVMLIEKVGYANFKIVDGNTGHFFYVKNSDFLTTFQEKQMSTQPDFILEYAHFLGDKFTADGHENVQVFVDSFVTLNGRLSQRFIDRNIDLYKVKESFKHKDWILPFKGKIIGL